MGVLFWGGLLLGRVILFRGGLLLGRVILFRCGGTVLGWVTVRVCNTV